MRLQAAHHEAMFVASIGVDASSTTRLRSKDIVHSTATHCQESVVVRSGPLTSARKRLQRITAVSEAELFPSQIFTDKAAHIQELTIRVDFHVEVM